MVLKTAVMFFLKNIVYLILYSFTQCVSVSVMYCICKCVCLCASWWELPIRAGPEIEQFLNGTGPLTRSWKYEVLLWWSTTNRSISPSLPPDICHPTLQGQCPHLTHLLDGWGVCWHRYWFFNPDTFFHFPPPASNNPHQRGCVIKPMRVCVSERARLRHAGLDAAQMLFCVALLSKIHNET